MTALKPIENRRVRGVASERYPLNEICAHPECTESTDDPHHCFPRSAIGNDSWFVEIEDAEKTAQLSGGTAYLSAGPFPHVTGLHRAHHDDVEEHRAWIKLEDGIFYWYDRVDDCVDPNGELSPGWRKLGPLNPQPGSRVGRPKKKPFKGEKRRQRVIVTMRVPKDQEEDGAGLLDDLHAAVEEKLGQNPARPIYYSIIDSFNYVLAHADESDVGQDEP